MVMTSYSEKEVKLNMNEKRTRRSTSTTSTTTVCFFFLGTLLFLCSCATTTLAFAPHTTSSRRITTLQTTLHAKPAKKPKKPSRFQQTVHHKTSKGKSRSTAAAGGPSSAAAAPPQQQQQQNQSDQDRLWKSQKSIDDLEARLTSRWGTDLQPWTAQDSELDDDDEDNSGDDSTTLSVSAPGDGNVPMFRANPVRDPWEKKNKPAPKLFEPEFEDDDDDNNDNSAAFSAAATEKDEGMLKRVRRNQQRLTEKREFYDADDEGYEPATSATSGSAAKGKGKGKGDLNFNHMIAPEPAGGKGTNYSDDDDDDEEEYGDSYEPSIPTETAAAPSGGGFFFRDSEAVAADTAAVAKQQAIPPPPLDEQPQRPARAKSISLLDEDGKPLLLTLKQAESDFAEMLRESDGNYDNDNSVYKPPETRSWQELGIDAPVLVDNLNRMNCERPLSVQDKSCPAIMSGGDVLVGTYTGSGKTLAFMVPLIQRILAAGPEANKGAGLQILIIAPGRELASQIASVARELLQDSGLGVMLAIGGTTFTRNLEQIRKRKPTVIVGTPGRLAELIVGRPDEKSGRLKSGALKALVLDEFDALLEYKPHRDPTNAILQTLKGRHGDYLQTVMCSATASDILGSAKLREYLKPDFQQAMADQNDLLVTSGSDDETANRAGPRVSRTVAHGVIHVPHQRIALDTLRRILHTEPLPQQILIFAENSRKVRIVVEKLEAMGIIAAPLHGGYGSEKMDRAEVSKALREGFVGIVVATELAARGLDAPLLTHVVNFDLPTDASHYAHRAGRCGRGGRPGVVINFTTSPQERNVPFKFAEKLGIDMYSVEARNAQLMIVDPDSQVLDPPRRDRD